MYAYWVIADYRAYLYSYSSDLVGLQKAAHLQPRNAEYQRLVGQYFWYLHNWQEAVGAYRRALALNPREPRFWLDLAQFYEMTGDHRNNVAALDRALQLDVTNPSLALEIANYYLLGNEIEKALHAFRLVAMYSDDENEVRLAMDRSWRATDDINRVIKDVMPDSPPAHFFLIESLLRRDEIAAVKPVWLHLIGLKAAFDPRLAFPYIESLLRSGAANDAARAWRDMANSGLLQSVSSDNLVTNGSFEADILNGGFDWRYEALPNVSVSIDTNDANDGEKSLAATFTGGATAGVGIAQYIAVQPDTEYVFSAYVKTEDIEGKSGPTFIIADIPAAKVNVATEELLGTTEWRRQKTKFKTATDTRLLLLRIGRSDTAAPIRGKIWIDDVRLTAVRDSNDILLK